MEANKSEEFNDILAKEMSDLYFDMFQIYKYINKDEVQLAVKIEKDFVKKFLINLYKEIYHVNYIITDNDLENFILYLCDHKMLPFTRDELKSYLKRTLGLDLSNQDDLSKATEIYTLLSKGFFDKIQKYLTEYSLNDSSTNSTEAEVIEIKNDLKESEELFNTGRLNESFLIKYVSIEKMVKLIYFKLFGKKLKFNNENKIDDIICQIEDEREKNIVDHNRFRYWKNIRNRVSHENFKLNNEQAEKGKDFFNEFSNNLKETIKEIS